MIDWTVAASILAICGGAGWSLFLYPAQTACVGLGLFVGGLIIFKLWETGAIIDAQARHKAKLELEREDRENRGPQKPKGPPPRIQHEGC